MSGAKQSPDAVVVSEPVVTREHRRIAIEHHWGVANFATDYREIHCGEDYVERGETRAIGLAIQRFAKALATIEHNARPRWIPVSENTEHPVPKLDQLVLFRLPDWPDGSACLGKLNDETGMWESEETDDDGNPRWSYGRFEVAGWFPIPPPPTGASDG